MRIVIGVYGIWDCDCGLFSPLKIAIQAFKNNFISAAEDKLRFGGVQSL